MTFYQVKGEEMIDYDRFNPEFGKLEDRERGQVGKSRCRGCYAEFTRGDRMAVIQEARFHPECAEEFRKGWVCQFCDKAIRSGRQKVKGGYAHEDCITEAQEEDERKRHDNGHRRMSWWQEIKAGHKPAPWKR